MGQHKQGIWVDKTCADCAWAGGDYCRGKTIMKTYMHVRVAGDGYMDACPDIVIKKATS